MQRGLIHHRAAQERVAVIFQCDVQAPKPVRPLRTQMALEPDLIDLRLTCIRSRLRLLDDALYLSWPTLYVRGAYGQRGVNGQTLWCLLGVLFLVLAGEDTQGSGSCYGFGAPMDQ